ncbi:Thioredoxin [Halorientalis regularis]|uniref:Thioredoxin n=2 Tax=Halorientalis regularis TaxID=660518 RepID=A0A1G7PA15_9EURY|nr:Thioredoxin [Halorientalis regularis]
MLGGIGTLVAGGGVVYGASRLDSDSAEPTSSESNRTQFHSRSETTGLGIELGGHPIMGEMDAPVDVYYWSDYQCPFCRRFEADSFPKIVENHVRPGTVRFVFIQYPYLSESSMTAAVMDRCVWRQVRGGDAARYLDWHSAVFDAQGEKNSGWASAENLLEITANVEGVDADAVETCLDSHGTEIEAAIETDVQQASQYGIRGSPAFVLYNRESDKAGKIVGAQPYERFDSAISKVKNA